MEEDERRAEKQRTSTFTFDWEKPLFDTPLGRRQLRILNSLFLAVARAGGKGWVSGKAAEDVSVGVHQQQVSLKLAPPPSPRRRTPVDSRSPKVKSNALRLSIVAGFRGTDERASWEDGETTLESQMTEIAVDVIVTAELHYREHSVRIHEWLIERKAKLEAELRRRQAEAERKESERLAALAKARIDRLLNQALSLAQANDIRSYVEAVCSAGPKTAVEPEGLERWRQWALEQADRLDPVVSGAFLVEVEADEEQPEI